jgi:hypothetical protein
MRQNGLLILLLQLSRNRLGRQIDDSNQEFEAMQKSAAKEAKSICHAKRLLSLAEFLGSKESNERYELADGELVPKISPTCVEIEMDRDPKPFRSSNFITNVQ